MECVSTVWETLEHAPGEVNGSNGARLESCARSAADVGLEVWVQPRLIDQPQSDVLGHLADAGRIAELISIDGGTSCLQLGCELSIFPPGLLRGNTYVERMDRLNKSWWTPRVHRRLNDYLAQAQQRARATFSGPITYAAGEWERVEWSGFDRIGINLYRDDSNRRSYASTISKLAATAKPVIITEFGTCSYAGAEIAGGIGHDLIDHSTTPPSLDPASVRDEAAQADHLSEVIEIFEPQGAGGCFVYAFSEPTKPQLGRPGTRSGQGQLRHRPPLPGDPPGGSWERKVAFGRLAKIYGARL